jgi:uncharacterized protein
MIKVRCPICDRQMSGEGPKEWPDWPFCGPRCKLIDLGRWLGGAYRLDSVAQEDEESADEEVTESRKSAVPSAVPHREEA